MAVKIKSDLVCGSSCDKSSRNVSTGLLSDSEQGRQVGLEKPTNIQVGFSLQQNGQLEDFRGQLSREFIGDRKRRVIREAILVALLGFYWGSLR